MLMLSGKLRKGGAKQMQLYLYEQIKRALVAFAVLVGIVAPARCQVDTSSYPRSYPAPSMLDTLGQVQQLELQRQQIEMQRLQIEQQRLQMQQSEQRQLEFERQQAELYRQRHAERLKAKKEPPHSN